MSFYPQSVVSQGTCLNSLLFRCFHFKLTFESMKELGSVSFDMKDLEEVLYCLRMQIMWNREEKTIKLGQKRYIEYILTRFGM